MRAFVRALADAPRSSLDYRYAQLCERYLARPLEPGPLTFERWWEVTRSKDFDTALAIDITEAESDEVFLFALRDLLVFSAGGSRLVISAISVLVDPLFDARTGQRNV